MGFTKLFSSLIFSTVWREELHVKVVWITMLALANRNGEVWSSVPGLADAAKVTVDQCREALLRLASPDPDSRTKTNEGRRIEEIDGGWLVLNYPKYRALRDADERRLANREYQRRHRAKSADGLTVSTRQTGKPSKPIAEAEAEAETTSVPTVPAAPQGISPHGVVAGMIRKYCYPPDGKEPAGHDIARDIRWWNVRVAKYRDSVGRLEMALKGAPMILEKLRGVKWSPAKMFTKQGEWVDLFERSLTAAGKDRKAMKGPLPIGAILNAAQDRVRQDGA